jgi:putative nucleotidyltransferase with HDIG domain
MLVGLLVTSGELVWLYILFQSLVLSFMVDNSFTFFTITLLGSATAARAVFGCKSRTDIYKAGVLVGVVQALAITCFHFFLSNGAGHSELYWLVPAGLFSGILSSLLTMTFIPLAENLFNVTTDVKLLELSNLNHPLMKQMVVKAPGTYHHCLIVGALCEAAGEEIGANPLLAKVMAYYHDIGKMDHAQYFIENQRPDYNPHDHISPYMSKTILVAHVKDGAEMGMKYNLGTPIIDGILQHHGTTLMPYFYNKALENQDEDVDVVKEEDFRYPGPKPQFKEAALVMLADSVEAAARAIDEPTTARLQNLVKTIIHRKFADGQLDECNLTFRELTIIERCFNRILIGVYHHRIDYPSAPTKENPPVRIATPRSGRGPVTA